MKNKFLQCEDEPINIPNYIQPIGYFIAINLSDKTISHVSQNAQEDFPEIILGEDIYEFIAEFDILSKKLQSSDANRIFLYNQEMSFGSNKKHEFDFIISFSTNEILLIEFLTIKTIGSCSNFCIANLTEKLLKETSKEKVFELATNFISKEIGYDRIMIYKFDKNYNGQVIYETIQDGMESYLNLCYPASDIPTQARELYLKNHIRVISNSSYIPSKIISKNTSPIDLTYSFLRNVSPIHLEYMRNMGVVASMTISLIIDGKLWGLIACHHKNKMIPSVKLINECEYLGKIVSSLVNLHLQNRLSKDISKFIGKTDILLEFFKSDSHFNFEEIVSVNLEYIKNLFDADGIILSHDGFFNSFEIKLDSQEIEKLIMTSILLLDDKEYFYTDSLTRYDSNLPEHILKECAGLLVLKPIPNVSFYIILTREEKQRELNWGGNPNEKIENETKKYLSPRNSFDKFIQIVMLTAQDWEEKIEEKINIFFSKIQNYKSSFDDKYSLNIKSLELKELQEEKEKHNEQLIDLLLRIIELRDAYTAGHTVRVSQICELIAIEMGISQEEILLLNQASKLHDIGKVIIPDSVLLKPGRLNHNEYDIIKLHLIVGYQMLSTIDYYKPVAEIMKYHHEKYDGSGYPYELSGDRIPLLSHIMIVADAFDAMTSNRIYQKRKDFKQAINELNAHKGIWYHPMVVEAIERITDRSLIEVSQASQIPLTKMEHERFSYFFKDQMTGFYNEPYLWMIINKQISHYTVTDFFMIELHGMSEYNKINGWHAGNILINNISEIILKRYDKELIFRLFGDDFLICFTSRENYVEKSKQWKEIKIGNVYSSSKPITKGMLIEELQSMW